MFVELYDCSTVFQKVVSLNEKFTSFSYLKFSTKVLDTVFPALASNCTTTAKTNTAKTKSFIAGKRTSTNIRSQARNCASFLQFSLLCF